MIEITFVQLLYLAWNKELYLKKMKINQIDTDQQVFIVAEIGNNHEGNFDVAQELIQQAAKVGVDAVKFQTYLPELYVSSEDQERLERLRKFQLNFEQFQSLEEFTREQGIIFFLHHLIWSAQRN